MMQDAGALPRIGMILLATDLTTERDAPRLIGPDEAGLHATRVAHANPVTPGNLRRMAPRLTDAAALLVPGEPLAAILYSCTSASAAIGEEGIATAIGAARPGVPVVTPTEAARMALTTLGARRIAILTPYIPETTESVAAHFAGFGFEVVEGRGMGHDDDRAMAKIPADAIIESACAADRPEAEALFVSCTALPVLGIIARIEEMLGKPVVTSNQASLWRLRALAGLRGMVTGYGRLFAMDGEGGRT